MYNSRIKRYQLKIYTQCFVINAHSHMNRSSYSHMNRSFNHFVVVSKFDTLLMKLLIHNDALPLGVGVSEIHNRGVLIQPIHSL